MGNLNLKVEIDKGSGFCFGVVEAINKAESYLNRGERIYCLGQIVHNEEEVARLEKKGMITISHEEFKNIKGVKVLFRAHGEPPESYEIAKKNGIELIDASCPIVTKLQQRVKRAYENGENVYIYGKHRHPEIIGLLGQTDNNAVVFQSIEELDFDKMPKEITLFSQTTLDKKKYADAIEILRKAGIKVKVNNTICGEVANRQPEIREFCKRFDKIVFVAGKKSSNGKVLYEVCRKANPNAHFVSSVDEIDNSWFNESESVGICGATSTPLWLMDRMKKYLESL
jgi:4-hydroxy-3-methylbut-2-enyl diphosphate reductase